MLPGVFVVGEKSCVKIISMAPIESEILHQKAQQLSPENTPVNYESHPLSDVVQHLADLSGRLIDDNSDIKADVLSKTLLEDGLVKSTLKEQFGTAFDADPNIALKDLFKMTALLSRKFVTSLAPILSGAELASQEMLIDELQQTSGELSPKNLNFILQVARLAVPNLIQKMGEDEKSSNEKWLTDFRVLEQKPQIVETLLSLVKPSQELLELNGLD